MQHAGGSPVWRVTHAHTHAHLVTSSGWLRFAATLGLCHLLCVRRNNKRIITDATRRPSDNLICDGAGFQIEVEKSNYHRPYGRTTNYVADRLTNRIASDGDNKHCYETLDERDVEKHC